MDKEDIKKIIALILELIAKGMSKENAISSVAQRYSLPTDIVAKLFRSRK